MAKRVLYELGRPGVIASPDGCGACGWPERGHRVWYVEPHLVPGVPQTYVRPDDATRLSRMKMRRAQREDAAFALRVSTCLACPAGCTSCTKDESDCECYEHQGDHPDAAAAAS